MASGGRRSIKREFGMVTPALSIKSRTESPSIKKEIVNLTDSCEEEDTAPSIPSNHGLPIEERDQYYERFEAGQYTSSPGKFYFDLPG